MAVKTPPRNTSNLVYLNSSALLFRVSSYLKASSSSTLDEIIYFALINLSNIVYICLMKTK
jgi:hypothetical protein